MSSPFSLSPCRRIPRFFFAAVEGSGIPAFTGTGEEGFSLIEALVALMILAIAAVGLVRAAEAHVDSIGAMEQRAAADWVASDRLVELGLGIPVAGEVEMLGRRWRVTEVQSATDDPDLRAVRIDVAAADGGERMASLDGFVDAGAAQ